MTEKYMLARLHAMLSAYGDVQSLNKLLPANADASKTLILATMRSEASARKLNQQYGFATFGFNSLIIPASWLSEHLSQSETSTFHSTTIQ
jgi:hypothetical protein